jgi:hypothetical protein
MTTTKEIMTLLTGNGEPEKGILITIKRVELKLDALMEKFDEQRKATDEHVKNKEMHRTEFDAQKKMVKVAIWLAPISIFGIVLIFWTLHGDWVKIGEMLTKWIGG